MLPLPQQGLQQTGGHCTGVQACRPGQPTYCCHLFEQRSGLRLAGMPKRACCAAGAAQRILPRRRCCCRRC